MKSLEELRLEVKKLGLPFNISREVIESIRRFHFDEGYSYGEIKNNFSKEIEIYKDYPEGAENVNEFFLKVLGYNDWSAYHKGRAKILKRLKSSDKIEIDDSHLLKKFKDIVQVTQKVKISWVAKSLGLNEIELFEKLIVWGKSLPFKIDDDLLVVEDLKELVDLLDLQFKMWKEKEKDNNGKI